LKVSACLLRSSLSNVYPVDACTGLKRRASTWSARTTCDLWDWRYELRPGPLPGAWTWAPRRLEGHGRWVWWVRTELRTHTCQSSATHDPRSDGLLCVLCAGPRTARCAGSPWSPKWPCDQVPRPPNLSFDVSESLGVCGCRILTSMKASMPPQDHPLEIGIWPVDR
jgi:hypothetical protein